MSVLVKGMEMPQYCGECQLAYDCTQCIVTGTNFIWEGEFRTTRKNFNPETDRLPDCPLVEVPTAEVVEVVRCGDCKFMHYNRPFDGNLPEGVDEYECRHWCGSCDPTDYCSYGERREDEQIY